VPEPQPLLARRPAPSDARVEDDEAVDELLVLDREAQSDGAAPVVHDEGQAAETELVDELLDRGDVALVRVPADVGRFVRAAEADQVGRDRAVTGGDDRRDDVAPQVRRRRLSVQQQDRRPLALVGDMHPPPVENRQAHSSSSSSSYSASEASPMRWTNRSAGRKISPRRLTFTTSASSTARAISSGTFAHPALTAARASSVTRTRVPRRTTRTSTGSPGMYSSPVSTTRSSRMPRAYAACSARGISTRARRRIAAAAPPVAAMPAIPATTNASSVPPCAQSHPARRPPSGPVPLKA